MMEQVHQKLSIMVTGNIKDQVHLNRDFNVSSNLCHDKINNVNKEDKCLL